jgi:hypothetical protein
MEKRDIIVIVIAIFIVLIMAMYIKPLVTGKPVQLVPEEISALFGGKNETLAIDNASIFNESQLPINASLPDEFNISSNESALTRTPTPSPVPTWNGSPIDVGLTGSNGSYIYPRTYPVTSDPVYSFMQETVPLVQYTKFSGQYSAKSNPFYIPTSYWELWYTVEVSEDLNIPQITTGSARVKNEDGTYTYQERMDSISVVNPYFSIKVLNADTESDIRDIIPPGGLNPRLWKGDFASPDPVTFEDDFKPDSPDTIEGTYNWDPRPWKEKFFEGYRNYYLDIDARNLISYSIDIKVKALNGSASSSTNLTNDTSSQFQYAGPIMDLAFTTYLTEISKNVSDPDTFGTVIGLLSSQVLASKTNDDIYRDIIRMQNAGITINGFKKTDVFVRGPEGSLKGEISYSTKTGPRIMIVDIPFVLQNNAWKINEIPIIRV